MLFGGKFPPSSRSGGNDAEIENFVFWMIRTIFRRLVVRIRRLVCRVEMMEIRFLGENDYFDDFPPFSRSGGIFRRLASRVEMMEISFSGE